MVSIIVIGRNDDYGVNLSKRTALSLNYYASLCEPGDEILYVDCNSDQGLPTLVESIADTLTSQARSYLRCYRISGPQMLAAIGETPLPFSDELARNVAIRRSRPENSWILSTNCDILLYPLKAPSIAQAIRDLSPKFYVCPRIGIPSSQWQMLERTNIGQIHAFGGEIIQRGFCYPPELKENWLRFGSNGDFQLAPRSQWLEMGGCEEAMKLWGHSDANNARRLSLLNGGGRTPDVGDIFCVMHLDHNLPRSSAATALPQNDWNRWVSEVTNVHSHNAKNWGMSDIDLPLVALKNDGSTSPGDILAATRREGLWDRWIIRLKARTWRMVTPTLRWFERLSSNKAD